MAYKLVKKEGTDKYFVMTTETGKLHSREPMTKEMAKRQMTALNIAMAREVPATAETKKAITMPYDDYMKEHRQLISILSLAGKEGERQRREMNRYI